MQIYQVDNYHFCVQFFCRLADVNVKYRDANKI